MKRKKAAGKQRAKAKGLALRGGRRLRALGDVFKLRMKTRKYAGGGTKARTASLDG